MEQRRLRLGDILDDYCPRERRVTNHAVVAMIEEDVKQTRCTTCDADHPYKGGIAPRRRKKEETPAALFKEVLAGMPEAEGASALASAAPASTASPALVSTFSVPADIAPQVPEPTISAAPPMDAGGVMREEEPDEPQEADEQPAIEGPVHRRLIRATLPRQEGQKEARAVPDFTVRHTPARGNGNGHGTHGSHGNGFRGAERMRMRAHGSGNGNAHPHREPNGNSASSGGGPRFNGRPSGTGRPPMGRPGGASRFRHSDGNGKRSRGPRG